MRRFFTIPFLLSLLVLTGPAQARRGIYRLDFAPLPLPATDQEKIAFRASPRVSIMSPGGKTTAYPLHFETLLRSGAVSRQGVTWGLITNRLGQPVRHKDGAPMVSNKPDGSSVLWQGGSPYLALHFEERPSALYAARLVQSKGGRLQAPSWTRADLSGIGGLMHACAATRTAWNTHLVPEEDYEMDAYFFDPATQNFTPNHVAWCEKDALGHMTGVYTPPPFAQGANFSGWCGDAAGMRDRYLVNPSLFNAYNYGYVSEFSLQRNGRLKVRGGRKHYVFGKATPEQALVLPDGRTVYATDDGGHRGFYMMVADRAGDLSAGTLFMARWHQKETTGGGSASLTWVRLGHTTSAVLHSLLKRNPAISDIFDIRDPKACPTGEGFRLVSAGDPDVVCVRLRDGKNGSARSPKFKNSGEVRLAAAFFEKRRYGALLGATAEFTALESMAYDADRNKVYFAVSGIGSEMEDNTKGNELPTQNHIRLQGNHCGAVYEMGLGPKRAMNSRFVGHSVKAIVAGKPLNPGEPFADMHACHPDFIASPDNIRYLPHTDTLLIGEDTSKHFNNTLFAYNLEKKTLTRVMTMPTGGEFAGIFPTMTWGGRSYVFVHAQGPATGGHRNASGEVVNGAVQALASEGDKLGMTGYLRGFPAMPWN